MFFQNQNLKKSSEKAAVGESKKINYINIQQGLDKNKLTAWLGKICKKGYFIYNSVLPNYYID